MNHDLDLFEHLLAEARRIEPEVRKGSMFGCPAVYVGRKMAACIYGSAIGFKVPEAVAQQALEQGNATPFQPYGKPKMREWVQLDGDGAQLKQHRALLVAAIAFAEVNNG